MKKIISLIFLMSMTCISASGSRRQCELKRLLYMTNQGYGHSDLLIERWEYEKEDDDDKCKLNEVNFDNVFRHGQLDVAAFILTRIPKIDPYSFEYYWNTALRSQNDRRAKLEFLVKHNFSIPCPSIHYTRLTHVVNGLTINNKKQREHLMSYLQAACVVASQSEPEAPHTVQTDADYGVE